MSLQYFLNFNFDDQLERFCLFLRIKNLLLGANLDQDSLKGTLKISGLEEDVQQDELIKRVEYDFDDDQIGTLSFVLRLLKSGVMIVEDFRLCDVIECKRLVHVEFKSQYGVQFNLASFRNFSLQFSECFSVDLNFEIHGIVDILPDSVDCDKSTLQVVQKPNPDLVNDWLFCHNHGESHEPLPELEPIVLARLEEIIYILTCDVDQILLESIEDKDQSIYLALIKRVYVSNSKGEYLQESNDCSNLVELDLYHKCVVAFKLFGFDRSFRIAENECTSPELCEASKQLLNKYRLSFEVDWYRVEAELYRMLHEQLLYASISVPSIDSQKFIESREWSISESKQNLQIATLDYICFK